MRFLIPKSRAGMLWRFFAAGVIMIGSVAGTTAVAGLLQVSSLVADISINKGFTSHQLQLPAPGKPQTILLIGSDHRAGEPFRNSNTDTMLLLRLNASSSTINVMSVPRDLEVQVPGYGTQKLNAAYSLGGYDLLIKTIRADVFPSLKVNHIIDTNFTGFSDLIDAIGCVYSDVDHRYYNNTALTNYSSIDIQPGYQKLCGDGQSVSGALPFVRFRHTDSDIVRNARQQDFLRWAKDQFSTSKLFSERQRLLTIFGKHSIVDKTLQSPSALIELFDLVLNADGSAIKQIPFPAILPGPTAPGAASYVTARAGPGGRGLREVHGPEQEGQGQGRAEGRDHPHEVQAQGPAGDQHRGTELRSRRRPRAGRRADQPQDAGLLPAADPVRLAVLQLADGQLRPRRRAGHGVRALLPASVPDPQPAGQKGARVADDG